MVCMMVAPATTHENKRLQPKINYYDLKTTTNDVATFKNSEKFLHNTLG